MLPLMKAVVGVGKRIYLVGEKNWLWRIRGLWIEFWVSWVKLPRSEGRAQSIYDDRAQAVLGRERKRLKAFVN